MKNEESLFLEFMMSNGFNPSHYSNILELIRSASKSMSKQLKDYEQFLLSDKVVYSDLEKFDIKGAKGYLDDNSGIIVPKTIDADKYFLYGKTLSKVPYKRHSYSYPNIDEFDVAISLHDWTSSDLHQIKSLLYYPINDYYFGFITNSDDEKLDEKIRLYYNLLDSINLKSSNRHAITHDTISKEDKELYLIKRR